MTIPIRQNPPNPVGDREQPGERGCRLRILVKGLKWSKQVALQVAVEEVLVVGHMFFICNVSCGVKDKNSAIYDAKRLV